MLDCILPQHPIDLHDLNGSTGNIQKSSESVDTVPSPVKSREHFVFCIVFHVGFSFMFMFEQRVNTPKGSFNSVTKASTIRCSSELSSNLPG